MSEDRNAAIEKELAAYLIERLREAFHAGYGRALGHVAGAPFHYNPVWDEKMEKSFELWLQNDPDY